MTAQPLSQTFVGVPPVMPPRRPEESTVPPLGSRPPPRRSDGPAGKFMLPVGALKQPPLPSATAPSATGSAPTATGSAPTAVGSGPAASQPSRSSQPESELPPLGSRPPPRRVDGPISNEGLTSEPGADVSPAIKKAKGGFGDTQKVPEHIVTSAAGPARAKEDTDPIHKPSTDEAPPFAERTEAKDIPPSEEPATIRRPTTNAPPGGGYVRRSERPPPRSVIPKPASLPGELGGDVARLRRNAERAEERSKSLARQLEASKLDLSAMDQKRRETVAKHEKLEREHGKLSGQHDSLRALVAVRAERIRELERMMDQRDARIAELERELSSIHEQHARALSEASEKHAQELAAVKMSSNEEKQRALDLIEAAKQEQLRLHSRPPPRPTDDLTNIKGIGPKFAKALNALGIATYAQIAAWTDDDLEVYAGKLKTSVKRIRNADWVTSAKQLCGGESSRPGMGSMRPPNDEVEGSW